MPQTNDVILRRLDGNERGLFQIANERHGALRVACCARLYGVPFSDDALRRAIAKIQQRHPLLNAVVRKDLKFHASDDAEVDVTRHQRLSSDSWQDVLDEELYSEAVAFDQPLMKVAVVVVDDGTEQEFELLLAVEHLVCDGISISSLLDEILTLTTQPSLNFESLQIPPSNEQPSLNFESLRIPPSIETCCAQQQWSFDAWIMFLNFAFFALKPLLKAISWCMKPVNEEPLRHRRFAVRSLNAAQTLVLIEAARRQQTSVSGALAATVMAATRMAQQTSSSSVPIICPIDLRSRYVHEPVHNNELAYHVGVVQLSDQVQDASSITADELWTLARSMRRSMMEKARGEVFAFAKLAGNGATAISARTKNSAKTSHSGFLSNWGKTPLRPSYGKWRLIQMIPLLRLLPTNIRQCLAATANGQLTMSFNIPDVVCSDPDAEVDVFADSIVSNLEKMVSASIDNAELKKRK